ncbi:hypothetical protein LX36DRAFT_430468 [Colletotrichum falcatum]|nr:hypothetical protein LX36DRAFT_430468 [Colletotrichum falcatum]
MTLAGYDVLPRSEEAPPPSSFLSLYFSLLHPLPWKGGGEDECASSPQFSDCGFLAKQSFGEMLPAQAGGRGRAEGPMVPVEGCGDGRLRLRTARSYRVLRGRAPSFIGQSDVANFSRLFAFCCLFIR